MVSSMGGNVVVMVRQEICRDIFKVYRDIKFRNQHSKARRLCHDREVLCSDNHNIMLRGNSVAT